MVLATRSERRAEIHASRDQAKRVLGVSAGLRLTDERGPEGPPQPFPCPAQRSVRSPGPRAGLEDGDSGGLDLPVTSHAKPLPGLTPSNVTPSAGLSAYWLKKSNKKVDQRCPTAERSLLLAPPHHARGIKRSIVRRREMEEVWEFPVAKIINNP